MNKFLRYLRIGFTQASFSSMEVVLFLMVTGPVAFHFKAVTGSMLFAIFIGVLMTFLFSIINSIIDESLEHLGGK